MTRKEEILAANDDAWHYKWESLSVVLNDITEEEAIFQYPVYSGVERQIGYPPSGTILWHLVHLAHCYLDYTSTIECRPSAPGEISPPSSYSLSEAITKLKHYRYQLRTAIASVPEDELDNEVFNYGTVAELARMTTRHDAWHGSQIAIAKRLYRMR
jgi:DinB family protein